MCHRFQGEDTSIGLLGSLMDRRAETFLDPDREAEREEDGIKIVAVHCRMSRHLTVSGEPDVTDLAFLLRFQERFHGPALGKGSFDILKRSDGVKLVQVEVVSLEQAEYLPGFLDCSHAAAQDFFLAKLRRGLRAGADGISLRLAHHVGCVDWLSYMWAEPVLAEFRRQTGRDPEPCNEDYTRGRTIRGAFYTQFLRRASAMARKAGKTFIHHLENRMLAPADADCYCQIYWDWRQWMREGLVDEIDLKYIGPDHSACTEEILPLAKRLGIRVNWISAEGEPRSRPRSLNESELLVERARAAGLDGINLYELWLYRRMTTHGHPVTRGGGEAIVRKMRAACD